MELAILGLLQDQELHGYELKKRLCETLGPLSSVSFGSLYPCLSRLEKAGAVKAVDSVGEDHLAGPMTGSLGAELAAFRSRRPAPGRGRRAKKVYGITARGREVFAELLAAEGPSDDERTFTLRLAFARHLPPDARLGLLERRRALLVERLAQARAAIRARRERMDAYTRSLLEHGTETTERDIAWLDRLISAERGQPAAPITTPPGAPGSSLEDSHR